MTAGSEARQPAADSARDPYLDMYATMMRIRLFEEEVGRLAEIGEIPGPVHLYSGEEAVAVGVIAHLRAGDNITSTHRGHGHLIAKGGDLNRMMAELYGRSDGYCHGKGGSMHMCDPDLGILGSNGIVGAGIGIAVGAAFSHLYRSDDNVAVAFFGDGATNIGSFHEAANMAAVLGVPCVLVCENNLYGEYMAQAHHQAITDISDMAAAYGMPGVTVDGMDVRAVHESAKLAIDRARSGGGPTLLECKTYRFHSHGGRQNPGPAYRDDAEVALWKARDPIPRLASELLAAGSLDRAELAAIEEEISGALVAARAFAGASAWPEPSALMTDVYSSARKS